jgi:hypothetical protein
LFLQKGLHERHGFGPERADSLLAAFAE